MLESIGVFYGFLSVILSCTLYNKVERNEKYYLANKFIKNRYTSILICLLISFQFSIMQSLCPFNNSSLGVDSPVFLYIGKQMTKGYIPYKELFDHKGIILYFLEYIGFLICPNKAIGVWIVEFINIFITSIFLYKLSTLFTESRIIRYNSVYFVLLSVLIAYFGEGGNYVEEYALPGITISLYIIMKYFINKKYKFYDVIISGICFTVVIFLRVNMAAVWGIMVLAVVISLFNEKRYSDILKCAVLFIIGMMIVSIPILLYTFLTESFDSMIRYYIKFNFSYTGSAASAYGFFKALVKFILFSGIGVIFLLLSFRIKFKDKIQQINLIFYFFTLFSTIISGRAYSHYAVIIAPFFLIPSIYSLSFIFEKSFYKQKISKTVAVSLSVFSILGLIVLPIVYTYYKPMSGDSSIVSYLESNTKEDDDVLILGNDVSVYLESNRFTKNRFFYHSPPIDISKDLYDEFLNEYKNNPSDYIVYIGDIIQQYNSESDSNLHNFLILLKNGCESGKYKLEIYENYAVYVKNGEL